MNKIKALALLALFSGVFTNSIGLNASEPPSKATQQESLQLLQFKIANKIDSIVDMPGISAKDFSAMRGDLSKILNALCKNGVYEVTGTDKDIRTPFVTFQAIMEDFLSKELSNDNSQAFYEPAEISNLAGIILTPMPATPLCTKGEISKGLVDPAIAQDKRIGTVLARTTIIRDFLAKGGTLSVAYPSNGLAKRTEEQQKIYKQELMNYPENLVDTPLNCIEVPTDLIGATYFFEDKHCNLFVFAIKMTQATNPQDKGSFGLWFGSLHSTPIQTRVQAIFNFLKTTNPHCHEF
ncbi:MAG: hypothetical protein H0X51_06385 [Parachlamydiaceae bacterium]|nr:hypothetical protein [Parachlamydiaceae bacterium]